MVDRLLRTLAAIVTLPRRLTALERALAEHRLLTIRQLAVVRGEIRDVRALLEEFDVDGREVRR